MRKIMFNDRYGLTEAVLSGRKTQTRRLLSKGFYENKWDEREDTLVFENDMGDFLDVRQRIYARYKVGEIVAVAQNYKDAGVRFLPEEDDEFGCHEFPAEQTKGWNNKMFVRADLMPHHIRITNIRIERLQDISDYDSIKEGIYEDESDEYFIPRCFYDYPDNSGDGFETPREAYASLIDRVSGKGTWESNPYVVVYEFKLVK